MLFAIQCIDRDDRPGLRAETRAAHLAYLDGFAGRMIAAGALLSDDGATPVGSLIVIDLEDRAACDAFAAADPYAKAGLFASVTIRPWRKAYPKG